MDDLHAPWYVWVLEAAVFLLLLGGFVAFVLVIGNGVQA